MSQEQKGLGGLVAELSQTNVELWHEEDKARVEDDSQVAQAKRTIDKLNQKRNNLIEQIDDFIIKNLQSGGGGGHGRDDR